MLILVLSPAFGQECAAFVGDGVDLLAFARTDRHKATVFQQLQGRVDRAGTRGVSAPGSLLKHLDHFVAVHRALLQQLQQGILQITPAKKALAARTERASLPKWATRAER